MTKFQIVNHPSICWNSKYTVDKVGQVIRDGHTACRHMIWNFIDEAIRLNADAYGVIAVGKHMRFLSSSNRDEIIALIGFKPVKVKNWTFTTANFTPDDKPTPREILDDVLDHTFGAYKEISRFNFKGDGANEQSILVERMVYQLMGKIMNYVHTLSEEGK